LTTIQEHLNNASKIDFLIDQQGLRGLLDDNPNFSLDQIWLKLTVDLPSLTDREDVVKVVGNIKFACRNVHVINKRHEESLLEQGRKTGIVKQATGK
jgi:hypothetical protein